MSLKNVVCKICGNFEGNQLFRVREMMFGFKDTFTYFQCAICECLQILDPPSDITKYYPSNYYSYSISFTETPSREVNRMVIEICDRYLSRCNVTTGSRILDVGCGAGAHVYALRESGYIHTLGIDPYIESDIEYENGALVKKGTIHDCGQEWILLHSITPLNIFLTPLRLSRL